MAAAAALIGIDCQLQDQAWPTLMESLDPGSGVVEPAVATIGSLGPDGRRAVPELVTLLDTQDASLPFNSHNR